MIEEIAHGDIFESRADALCVPVNTVGVMGKGLAKAVRERWPHRCSGYISYCAHKRLLPGTLTYDCLTEPLASEPRCLLFVATKQHWRNPSQLAWIEQAAPLIVESLLERGMRSVAIPALGCGNGGLKWPDVRFLLMRTFGRHPEIEVELYP